MEVAWQAHFVKNMFIRPTDEELEKYGEPDFVVLNASEGQGEELQETGLNSETAVVFNLTEKMQVIINTWYGGEMKGMFSLHELPAAAEGHGFDALLRLTPTPRARRPSSVCRVPARSRFLRPTRSAS